MAADASSNGEVLPRIVPHMVALLAFSLAAVFINWKVLQDGVMYAAEDIWWHIFWLKEFCDELAQGIIYPRWLSQSNFLYGSPTFVFYPPLCFFIGALLKNAFALSVMQTTSALTLTADFFCGCNFYLMGRRRFGDAAAIVGGLIYMTAPFIAFDIYFRAAIPELWAMAWLPLVMFADPGEAGGSSRIQRVPCLLLTLGLFFLALTHIPSLVIFLAAWASLLCFRYLANRSKSALALSIGSAVLGLGCASFFLVPLVLERELVDLSAVLAQNKWLGTLIGSSSYHGHAMVLDIAMSSSVCALIIYCLLLFIGRYRDDDAGVYESTYWFGLNLVTLFLMSEASSFIWKNLVLMQCLQFPYRLMTVNCFAVAVLGALCISKLLSSRVKSFLQILIVVLIGFIIFLQAGLDFLCTKFRSGLDRPAPHIMESESMRGQEEYARYMMPRIFEGSDGFPGVPEYRPLIKSALSGRAKPVPAPHHGKSAFTLVKGVGEVKPGEWTSYRRSFRAVSKEPITVAIRSFVYPGWKVYVDGKLGQLAQAEDGSMLVSLDPGEHDVRICYEDSDVYRLGLGLSAVSIMFLVFSMMMSRSKNKAEKMVAAK